MRWCLVILLLVACSCGGNDHNQTPTGPSSPSSGASFPGLVRGQVVDFQSGAVIAGATLVFTDRTTRVDSIAHTDTTGRYSVALTPLDTYTVTLDTGVVGFIRVTPSTRGDFYIDRGTCVSRYGVISDANTGAPVAGATVNFYSPPTTTTAADGWYRLDLGCPDSGGVGFNTTFLKVTHPNYADGQMVVGRGVRQVQRLDLALSPR